MNKEILMDYIDACELVKEIEEDIRKLKKRDVVHDKVYGSNPDFPYQAQSFSVNGVTETSLDHAGLEKEQQLLKERMMRARYKKVMVEDWMKNAPARIQRIVRLKYFKRLSWEEVAVKLGGNATSDSAKKELQRFLKEN